MRKNTSALNVCIIDESFIVCRLIKRCLLSFGVSKEKITIGLVSESSKSTIIDGEFDLIILAWNSVKIDCENLLATLKIIDNYPQTFVFIEASGLSDYFQDDTFILPTNLKHFEEKLLTLNYAVLQNYEYAWLMDRIKNQSLPQLLQYYFNIDST